MSSWNTDWSTTMPTVQAFQGKTSYGATYTDWTGYNDAVKKYNAAQQDKQYQQGLSLYQQAAKLFQNNGVYNTAYNNAKKKSVASTMSSLVSRGLGNLANAATAGAAYDADNWANYEMMRMNALSQALQNMGQYVGGYTPTQAQGMSVTTTYPQSSKNTSTVSSGSGKLSAGQSTAKSPFYGVSFL